MEKLLALVCVCTLFFAGCSEPSSGPSGIQPERVLSTGKRVYFSSQNESMNMPASNVTDGDLTTVWASDTTGETINEYVMVDLRENSDISQIDIHWGVSRGIDYTISTSRGGIEFTEASRITAADPAQTVDTLTFSEPITARYVKLHVTRIPAAQASFIGATVQEITVTGKPSADQTLGSETQEMIHTKIVTPADTDIVNWGRTTAKNKLYWSGAVYEYACTGRVAAASISGPDGAAFEVSIDGGAYVRYQITDRQKEFTFSENLGEGEHVVQILRINPPWTAPITVDHVIVEETGDVVKNHTHPTNLKLKVLGDSITCAGTMNNGTNYYSDCYAFLTAKALNAELQICAVSGAGLVNWVHATDSIVGERNLATLYNDIAMDDDQYTFGYDADVVVINIGTNDSTTVRDYGTEKEKVQQYVETFEKMYIQLLEDVHKNNPRAALVATCGQMGCGTEIRTAIQNAVAAFNTSHPDIKCEAFFLSYMLDGGAQTDWHPGTKSHARDAVDLTAKIKEILAK